MIWIPGTLLRMAVVSFVLSAEPVLDIMAVALLAFHDAVILRTTSQLSLPTLAVVLVDLAAGIAGASVLFKVRAEVAIIGTVCSRLLGVVLIDLLLDGGEVAARRSIGSI
jgi:hypothetical protein